MRRLEAHQYDLEWKAFMAAEVRTAKVMEADPNASVAEQGLIKIMNNDHQAWFQEQNLAVDEFSLSSQLRTKVLASLNQYSRIILAWEIYVNDPDTYRINPKDYKSQAREAMEAFIRSALPLCLLMKQADWRRRCPWCLLLNTPTHRSSLSVTQSNSDLWLSPNMIVSIRRCLHHRENAVFWSVFKIAVTSISPFPPFIWGCCYRVFMGALVICHMISRILSRSHSSRAISVNICLTISSCKDAPGGREKSLWLWTCAELPVSSV